MVLILLSLKSTTSIIYYPLSSIIFVLRGANLFKIFIDRVSNYIFKYSRLVFLFNFINYKEYFTASLSALLDHRIYINSTYKLKLH